MGLSKRMWLGRDRRTRSHKLLCVTAIHRRIWPCVLLRLFWSERAHAFLQAQVPLVDWALIATSIRTASYLRLLGDGSCGGGSSNGLAVDDSRVGQGRATRFFLTTHELPCSRVLSHRAEDACMSCRDRGRARSCGALIFALVFAFFFFITFDNGFFTTRTVADLEPDNIDAELG